MMAIAIGIGSLTVIAELMFELEWLGRVLRIPHFCCPKWGW